MVNRPLTVRAGASLFPAGEPRSNGGSLPLHSLEGHAIVSGDDRIADADGDKPPGLDHPADWARFQSALDDAALVVMGRRSHEASRNPHHRNRLVLSRSVSALEKRGDGCWWNPQGAPLEAALDEAAPDGGKVAVVGGREVFDYFISVGFDAFHLTRNAGITLPGGVPVFSACSDGTPAEAVLEGGGLKRHAREVLDAMAGVSVTVWRRGRTEPR
jgi:dihydrofolate reductase